MKKKHSTEAVRVILVTAPANEAENIARKLVEERLIACANIIPGVVSLYWWKGAIEEDREQQLVIKTTRERVSAIEARFHEPHPYELPEFVVLSGEASTAYLDWLRESVGGT